MSLRSGTASSGIVFIDHQPAAARAATAKRTVKRFCAESFDEAVDHLGPPPDLICDSESIRKLPVVTMRSPARSPVRISVRSPICSPMWTARGS